MASERTRDDSSAARPSSSSSSSSSSSASASASSSSLSALTGTPSALVLRDDTSKISRKRKRTASVYDAVAGRVTTTTALDEEVSSEAQFQRRLRASRRDPTLAPEEVLFRRTGAPIRYAEKDIYHAHERLSRDLQATLPDSDMLKAIHSYSGHFYAANAATGHRSSNKAKRPHRSIDERSMDETALLAFGILLEETGRSALGRRGDLVLTEGVEADPTNQEKPLNGEAVGFLDADMPQLRSG